MDNYPSNSLASKKAEETKEEKKLEPIVSGTAKVQKKTFWSNLKELSKGAAKTVCEDILVPSIQKTVSTMINNMVDIMIYGEPQSKNNDRVPASRVSYQSYYNNSRNSQPARSRAQRDYSYDDIVLSSRGDAEAILDELDNIIRKYGYCKVADLFELAGLPTKFTDNNYGWTDLRSAHADRCRDGYLLQLPKPMALD